MANTIVQSSIGKKVAMALSGLFLLSFLSLHFFINLMSVFSAATFNEMSHFMGYNPVIQFLMQPILVAGVVFHFVMGFVLELKNRSARPQSYAKYNGSANASWASRNMIISGIVVLVIFCSIDSSLCRNRMRTSGRILETKCFYVVAHFTQRSSSRSAC